MGGSLATAPIHGWRTIGAVLAMDPHRQVVLAEGDHAAAQGPDGPLAPHPLLEVEADEDPKSEDELADLLVGVRIGCQGVQVVDRRHQDLDLLLGRLGGRRHGLWCGNGVDLSPDVCPLLDERIKGLGDGGVAGIVTFGGHPPRAIQAMRASVLVT